MFTLALILGVERYNLFLASILLFNQFFINTSNINDLAFNSILTKSIITIIIIIYFCHRKIKHAPKHITQVI